MNKLNKLYERVMLKEAKYKVGDKVKIDSKMGGTFTILIKSISGKNYKGVVDNKHSDFHNQPRTFTDKDVKQKLS